MRRFVAAVALALTAAFTVPACDVVEPLSTEERVYICAYYRPWPGGHIYFVAKVDPNSLKCWLEFDGCWTYQLNYIADGNYWERIALASISCPPEPV